MKRFLLITCLLLSILLISCNPEEDGNITNTGSITVTVNNGVRGLEPTISLKTSQYKITLSGPNEERKELSLNNETSETTTNDLAAGEWTVTVDAINQSGTVIGTGNTTVIVKANETAEANVTVSEIAGDGTLAVTLEGENRNNSTYTLQIYKNENGTDTLVKEQPFALDESNILKARVTLSNGFYIFRIISSNTTEICPSPETVRIIKGDSISVSYSLSETEVGKITIAIENAIVPNQSLNLHLSSSALHPGDSVTITASGLENESYKYEWYVDRMKVEGEANSLTVDELAFEGEYEVCCIARSTSSALVWSASKSFEVSSADCRPQSITVSGEVEFYLASDVLLYYGTAFNIKDKKTGYTIVDGRHNVYTFSDETEICAELENWYSRDYADFSSYTYYFEEKYIPEYNRTLVYVVVDRDIDNYGYVTVHSGDIGTDLDPYKKSYLSKLVIGSEDLCIPYLPYNDSRTIKMECGTYNMNYYGTNKINLNIGLIRLKFDKSQVTVNEGETTELTLGQSYKKYTFNNSVFRKGDRYEVSLRRSNDMMDGLFVDADDGALNLLISSNWNYNEVIIWNLDKTGYFRISRSELSDESAVNVDFTSIDYTAVDITIPKGRVKFETESDTLIPSKFTEIIWRLTDTAGNYICYDNLDLWTKTYSYDFETKIAYTDLYNQGYSISAAASQETDDEGAYTLVTLSLHKEIEDYGTLIVRFDISGFDMTVYDNRTGVYLNESGTDSYFYVLIKSAETQTLKVEPAEYSLYSYWRNVTGTDGKSYRPVTSPETFTVESGKTTTITVKMESSSN